MKSRSVIIIGVVLVVIIICIIVSVMLTVKPAPTATTSPLTTNPFADDAVVGNANLAVSPDAFAISFFKWYIGSREVTIDFPTQDQLVSVFTPWTTSSFILHYQETLNSPGNETDPILYAQDDPSDWGLGITATILSQTSDSSTVKVTVGTDGIHIYTVQLVKGNGHWLINSISGTN